MPLEEFLKDWVINYVKSKDVFRKTIKEIKKDVSEIAVIHSHKEEIFYIDPFLEKIGEHLKKIKKDSHSIFVCMNTKENFKKMLELWNELVDFSHLGVIFLNPFSKTEKLWTIFPHTHNLIADEASLKTGLQTMFEQIESVERSGVEKMYENE